jgi:cytochrome oxidase Cu insertion factor (SCO1/SenC/PrrC family)
MKNNGLPLLFILGFMTLTGCQGARDDSSASIPKTSPTTSPTYNPSLTDLNRVKPGTLAPDFTLEDISGNRFRLSDYRGNKFVVLVFYRGYF